MLLREEKAIRHMEDDKGDKGKRLAEIQTEISMRIAANVGAKIEAKIQEIIKSDKPQSKVFKVRRELNKSTNIDFPLKDAGGVLQVSRSGVDTVISSHFGKVFGQNPVPDGWEEYWGMVDTVFSLINDLTINEYNNEDEPTEEEIVKIISGMDPKKANYGPLTIDLVKLGGVRIYKVIYRCILMCFKHNIMPEKLREEKMILLLKPKGVIDIINDYRGIFLRNIILSVYQKWLYTKNAPCVDDNGSEFACGGRKERSGLEALLIVKLVQDHCRWTKTPVVIKFLDVEKFFDSMNFKLGLIQAYLSGVRGRFWQSYKVGNERKTCVPHIPSGACNPINIENVFVQGSCDAVLVAWPLMDAYSKRRRDGFSTNFYIEDIQLNRLSFVDDLILFATVEGVLDKTVDCEVFEKASRLKFKISKCKIMPMNTKVVTDIFNGSPLEVVMEHEYLGTIVSQNGERFVEMRRRITMSKSVANEIEQICKLPELSVIRLQYAGLLINACLDSKVRYGSALWNICKYIKDRDAAEKIKPNLLKRILEVPQSTPSVAIQYEFGVNDMSLDVIMEKIILAVETLNRDEMRISKNLLSIMMEKKVPGFCTEVSEACRLLGVSLDDLLMKKDVRQFLKRSVIKIQSGVLLKRMLLSSKMDNVVMEGFKYDGSAKKYLRELKFSDARVIFMSRYRMWPTKNNFHERWDGILCNVCGFKDTDQHIFSCPGFADIVEDNMWFGMFWDEKVLGDMLFLAEIAKVVKRIIKRLEEIQCIA